MRALILLRYEQAFAALVALFLVASSFGLSFEEARNLSPADNDKGCHSRGSGSLTPSLSPPWQGGDFVGVWIPVFTGMTDKAESDCAPMNLLTLASGKQSSNLPLRRGELFTYKLALPGRKIIFPQDHFSHPGFKTEWWYYTGHFETESGKSYGYQVTFFRFGLRDRQKEEKAPPRFESSHRGEPALRGPQGRESIRTVEPLFTDLHMAHFALSDKQGKKFRVAERANRGYNDKAGAAVDRYLVWNEDWKVEAQGENHFIEVKDKDVTLKLRLVALKPPVLHGDNGLSQKAEGKGRASYYYSLTRLKTEGELEIAGKRVNIHGQSWMDHEFGSNQLAEDQLGWDWFSIQLDNNVELMLYLMRRKDGSIDPYSSGTLVYANGTTRRLGLSEFQVQAMEKWKSPKSGGDYPMRWKVAIPGEAIELEIVPFFPDQELDTRRSTKVIYWEGSAQVRGTFQNKPVQGLGYVEMTGYAGKLKI